MISWSTRQSEALHGPLLPECKPPLLIAPNRVIVDNSRELPEHDRLTESEPVHVLDRYYYVPWQHVTQIIVAVISLTPQYVAGDAHVSNRLLDQMVEWQYSTGGQSSVAPHLAVLADLLPAESR